jgi:hypothetical protein
MSAEADPLEWLLVRAGLVVVAVIMVAVGAGWKVRDARKGPAPTRLELALRCLGSEKGVATTVPAGDPLADSAGDGSFKTTIEGNEVTVALGTTEEQAARIERSYRAVAGDLTGRLERRADTVYLWKFESSPTQRQTMYDCRY